MEVTDVKVYPVSEDKLKAYVTITFDNCFIVRDLKVIHGASGLFVAMPSKRRKDGTYKDTAHPINSETRTMIETKVLEEYDRELRRSGRERDVPVRPINGRDQGDELRSDDGDRDLEER
jgi:stage V sporulation protein G